ncbi:MAG: glycosyltransferase family 1 protein [Acidobacteria bacterium]|nr:MAG: glycosyltransferase family 1 protein [Acidobacteriota bacterium]
MKIGYLMQAGAPDLRSSPSSGPANHVKHVFRELKSLGHQVRLITLSGRNIFKSDDLEEFVAIKVGMDRGVPRLVERVVRRAQYELTLPYAAFFESLRFASACVQELAGFDLLYERMGWVGYGAALVSRRLNIPLVLEINGDHLNELEMLGVAPRGLQRKLSMSLVRWAVNQALYAVATGEGWRRQHICNWNVPAERIAVIENGTVMVDLLRRSELRSFCGSPKLEGGPVTIIYVGALEPWQGLSILLRAVAAAIRKGAKVQLLLAGRGSLEVPLKREAEKLGLGEEVRFSGSVGAQELARLLASADIGVSCYAGRCEYSGLKLLDYKAAGLAIIASGRDGEPAILQHGRTGWIVPPGNESALTDAIRRLAEDADTRRALGREARLEAELQHSWRHTAQELVSLFNRLLSVNTIQRATTIPVWSPDLERTLRRPPAESAGVPAAPGGEGNA